jgi:hypothetical protein
MVDSDWHDPLRDIAYLLGTSRQRRLSVSQIAKSLRRGPKDTEPVLLGHPDLFVRLDEIPSIKLGGGATQVRRTRGRPAYALRTREIQAAGLGGDPGALSLADIHCLLDRANPRKQPDWRLLSVAPLAFLAVLIALAALYLTIARPLGGGGSTVADPRAAQMEARAADLRRGLDEQAQDLSRRAQREIDAYAVTASRRLDGQASLAIRRVDQAGGMTDGDRWPVLPWIFILVLGLALGVALWLNLNRSDQGQRYETPRARVAKQASWGAPGLAAIYALVKPYMAFEVSGAVQNVTTISLSGITLIGLMLLVPGKVVKKKWWKPSSGWQFLGFYVATLLVSPVLVVVLPLVIIHLKRPDWVTRLLDPVWKATFDQQLYFGGVVLIAAAIALGASIYWNWCVWQSQGE